MFIAHVPAGYLVTKSLQKKFNTQKALWLGLFASILPDLDIFYFYFVDERRHHHHSYWLHIPFWWLVIAVFTAVCFFLFKNQKQIWFFYAVFFLNVFLHLFLDTIVGDILWLYPFSKQMIHFFYVEARFDFWVWNFILHWSFLLEVGLVILAVRKFYQERICPTST